MKDEVIELSSELKEKIKEKFENIKRTGANIWNGEVFCVSKCKIKDKKVVIVCKKSDYAHYLYGERTISREELNNLKRNYLIPLLQLDSRIIEVNGKLKL